LGAERFERHPHGIEERHGGEFTAPRRPPQARYS